MKKIAIVGSGIGAMFTTMTLLNKKNLKITIFESGETIKKNSIESKYCLNKSFKYNSKEFIFSKEKFLKNYNISEKNFFLSSVNLLGGLSNFWGGGIEIPEKKFLIKNYYPKSIINLYPKIIKILNVNAKKIKKFFNLRNLFFYNLLDKLSDKKFKIQNLDISLSGNKTLNTKSFFSNLAKKKLIQLCLNHHIETVKKKNDKYSLFIKKNDKFFFYKDEFDIIILCAGTIGSTILVAKYLNLQNRKIRFYNNPMLQLCFFGPQYYFKDICGNDFSHPLKLFHYKDFNLEAKGSLIPLKYFSNHHLGYSKDNFLINFIKKGIIAGNIFLNSKLSNNFILIKKKKTLISFCSKIKQKIILKKIKKKIKEVFKKIHFFHLPFVNFKPYTAGSDAHYTSSLNNLKIGKNKVIRKNCELLNNKNFYVLDGSVIPRGTFYPSFLIALNAYYYSNQIAQKNENK